jgi:polysaccharide pyruvyl transferase WcaK-like protein
MSLISKFRRYYKTAYLNDHFPSLSSIIFSRKKIFVYYGYLGDKNFGDELVYDGAKLIFNHCLLIPVRRLMPVALIVFVKLFKKRISGIVIGGGTLIGPFWNKEVVFSLLALNKPVFLHGTGVHADIPAAAEWTKVLNGKVYGGVRGPNSVKNISKIYKAKIVGDAAFAFYDTRSWHHKGESKNVLINLGTHFEYDSQDISRNEFEKFIAHLLSENYAVDFLCFHENDFQQALVLQSKFPSIKIISSPKNYLDAVNIFKQYAFAIGERLHFTVLAIMSKTPFLSINYGAKHTDLLLSLGLEHCGIDPKGSSCETFVQYFDNLANFDWEDAESKMEGFKLIQQSGASEFIKAE